MPARTNHVEFAAKLRKLSPWVLRVAAGVHKEVAFSVLTRTMEKTPVQSGRLRGNWQISFGSASSSELGPRSASEVLGAARAVLCSAPPLQTIFLTNNMPYAGTVEYGGYPKSVKHGTYIRKSMRDRISDKARVLKRDSDGKPMFVQFSEGGYSRQAPKGMLRVSVEELSGAVEGIVREVLAEQGAKL